ncbi:LuxR family transcriptional regulator [Christiangramia salexigens]|uniref:LuxR family transcriptional regulator n=2 Tax=Christiangramia salexigens TaxID=1913577 RepID=A0A1L3J881_9FLAO|nr:LuxR family transcriptional regulator [Christiangramia salexigens]
MEDTSKAKELSRQFFKIKSANDWLTEAKSQKPPKMLFGEFWHTNELCILFADTNLGKSILAVQIGNSISKGLAIGNFKLEQEKQQVLYFDFELTSKQFEIRYSKKSEDGEYLVDHFNFDTNFNRVEINPDAEIPEGKGFEEHLNDSLEKSIVETQAKILIIDNITYLNHENEKARDVLPMMKKLKALKSKYDLSLLALAHTPKRDLSKPITRNDLQGSKMLINFVDSCFTIGESHQDTHLRYLKQIKARNTEIVYDSEKVATFQILKQENFLKFDFIKFTSEGEHLKQITDDDRDKLIEEVKALNQNGMSQREIAAKLGISLGSVNKYCRL